MENKPLINRYSSFIYIFFLVFFSFSINLYYAYIGVLPVDSFSTFNAGYDILNGSVPFRDYWILKGIIIDFIQAGFFKIFGVSWLSYSIHSSTFNSIFALATFFTFRKFELNIRYSFFYSICASILMYPTYGIPFTDHTTAIFCMLSIYSLILAMKTENNIFWFLIPIFIFLAFFTKQTPTGYFGILIIFITIFYLLFNFKKEVLILSAFGSILVILIFFSYVYLNKIPINSIITQYFLYPMSLGETRLEWLLPFEIQRFVLRHKLIYLALSIPIFLLFKNIRNIFKTDYLIFLLLIGTLLIFITHQLMTINGLYIYFLIPVFAGISHIYSKTFKNEKILINFFLILSLVSTIYYHQKYISKRDTLLLKDVDFNRSVNSSILSKKLKNLKWITHNYPLNPEQEIENLKNAIRILEKDDRKKMIVTDYQFISVILSIKDNSAARIWWRHHIYPVRGNKYFNTWKDFLLKKIKDENIKVIYTIHPLEGEKDIFEGLIDEDCFFIEKESKILTVQKLNNCNELMSFKK